MTYLLFITPILFLSLVAGHVNIENQKKSCRPGQAISDIWWTEESERYKTFYIACENVTDSCKEVSGRQLQYLLSDRIEDLFFLDMQMGGVMRREGIWRRMLCARNSRFIRPYERFAEVSTVLLYAV